MNTIQNAIPTSIATPLTLSGQGPGTAESPQGTTSFKDFLLQSIQEVNTMQQSADQAVEKLAGGGDVSPAEVLTAVQKADVAFRMMMQIRNKITQAYEDLQNVRV
jgi:flagellar hook-basal body complex protein FliE